MPKCYFVPRCATGLGIPLRFVARLLFKGANPNPESLSYSLMTELLTIRTAFIVRREDGIAKVPRLFIFLSSVNRPRPLSREPRSPRPTQPGHRQIRKGGPRSWVWTVRQHHRSVRFCRCTEAAAGTRCNRGPRSQYAHVYSASLARLPSRRSNTEDLTRLLNALNHDDDDDNDNDKPKASLLPST